MTLPIDIKDLEKQKFVEDGSGDVAVRTAITVEDIEIGSVELKDATTDTRAVVKSDGTNNALVVTQNAQPLPTGASTSAKQDTMISNLQTLNSLVPSVYDYIALVQATLTDTWTFKTGGSGGTTVSTIVVTFTDSGKGTISNVAKT